MNLSDRHPLQLVKRVLDLKRQHLLSSREVRPWSDTEVAKLKELTLNTNLPKWRELQPYFPDRRNDEIRHKYRMLFVKRKFGPWTREEDVRVLVGVKVFGENWI